MSDLPAPPPIGMDDLYRVIGAQQVRIIVLEQQLRESEALLSAARVKNVVRIVEERVVPPLVLEDEGEAT